MFINSSAAWANVTKKLELDLLQPRIRRTGGSQRRCGLRGAVSQVAVRLWAVVIFSLSSGDFRTCTVFAGEPNAPVVLLGGAQAAKQARLAVPDSEAVKAALVEVKTIFKQEIEAATTTAKRLELAGTLLAKATQSGDDAVGQYALLRMAEDYALMAANATVVFDAIEQRTTRFDIDALQEKRDALVKLSKIPRKAALHEQLLVVGAELVDEADAANRFDLALQVVRLSVTLAGKSGKREAAKDANRREKEVRERQKAYDAALTAAEKLQDDPDDGEANLRVGRYLCSVRHDWPQGLPLLAKCGDAKLRALAQLDLTAPKEAIPQLALADRWWDLAAGDAALQQRARHWYRLALPGLNGLTKAHAENRLAAAESTAKASDAGSRTLQIALSDQVKVSFRRIAPGKFQMGSPFAEPNREDLELQHSVTLTKPYYIGVTEVTQAQWQAVVNSNPSESKGETLPVQNVYWDQCVAYCETLNKSPLGAKYHFRLPTEAEWEYACRAGTQATFSFGNDATQAAGFCWSAVNGEKQIHPVGQLKPNAWGLYDMHGNVSEWCQDTLNPYPTGPQTNPLSTQEARSRVHRGGNAWCQPDAHCRSASRSGNPATEIRSYIGLRLVVDLVSGN